MDTRWADGNVKRDKRAIGANIVRLRQSHLDSAGDSQTGSHDEASINDAVRIRSCASRFKVAGGGAELLRGTVLRRSSPHRLSSLDSNTQEHIPAGLWGVKRERPEECETAPLSSRPCPTSRRSSGANGLSLLSNNGPVAFGSPARPPPPYRALHDEEIHSHHRRSPKSSASQQPGFPATSDWRVRSTVPGGECGR